MNKISKKRLCNLRGGAISPGPNHPPIPLLKHDNIHLQLLKLLAENPHRSQRELSRSMGVALGSVNYCLTSLIDKGYVKLENFKKSDKRKAYAYMLTPAGLEEKLHLTYRFLKRRIGEYAEIKAQIKELTTDLADQAPDLLKKLNHKDLL